MRLWKMSEKWTLLLNLVMAMTRYSHLLQELPPSIYESALKICLTQKIQNREIPKAESIWSWVIRTVQTAAQWSKGLHCSKPTDTHIGGFKMLQHSEYKFQFGHVGVVSCVSCSIHILFIDIECVLRCWNEWNLKRFAAASHIRIVM